LLDSRSNQSQDSYKRDHSISTTEMGSFTEDCTSTTGLSFLKRQGGGLKLLIFSILAFSCLSLVVAAPTDPEVVSLPNNKKGEVITIE
jgi:hypothetical protein